MAETKGKAQAKTGSVRKAAPKTPKNPEVTIGGYGLGYSAGYVQTEFLPQLQGARGAKTYREMRDNDAVIGSAMTSMETLLRQVNWQVDPEDENNPQDTEAAEILEEQWDKIDPANFLAEALEFLPYGWAFFETIYERDGNFLGWKEFAGRAQESLVRWEFDPDGSIVGMWQRRQNGLGEVLIPIEKAIHIRTTKKGNNPEGRSILRSAYVSWYRKTKIESVESIGIERDLAGIPVFTVPSYWTNPSDPNHRLFLDAETKATAIRRDEQEGLVIPAMFDANGNQIFKFELLKSGGAKQYDTNSVVKRYDSRIAMVLMADFLMLGHDKTGSFALGSSKIDLFSAAISSWLDIIQAAVNLEADKLFTMNGIQGRAWLRHADPTPEDVTPLVENIERLVKAGVVISDDELENWARDLIGAPLREGPSDRDEEDDDPAGDGEDNPDDPQGPPTEEPDEEGEDD